MYQHSKQSAQRVMNAFSSFLSELHSREILDGYLSRALNVKLENGQLTSIDDSAYVLTMDYTLKMLNIHERSITVDLHVLYNPSSPSISLLPPSIFCLFLFPPPQLYRYQCGVPVIIEGETGVGKTALVEMLSKLWNHSLLLEWSRQRSQLLDLMKRKLGNISIEISEKYQVCDDFCRTMYVVCFTRISETVHIIPFFFIFSLLWSFHPSFRCVPKQWKDLLQASMSQKKSCWENCQIHQITTESFILCCAPSCCQ